MKLTLCGSGRFENMYHELNRELSLRGHVVYGMAVYASQMEGIKDWYTDEQKKVLDEVHKKKIDNSEAIVVINVNGYIGDSTRSEIDYADAMDRGIFWLEPPSPRVRSIGELGVKI